MVYRPRFHEAYTTCWLTSQEDDGELKELQVVISWLGGLQVPCTESQQLIVEQGSVLLHRWITNGWLEL